MYFATFLAAAGLGVTAQAANVAGVAFSTVLANELHRRITFAGAGRVGWWSAQWAGVGLLLVGLCVTALAIEVLTRLHPGSVGVSVVMTAIGVNGAVGALKFVALRALVFN